MVFPLLQGHPKQEHPKPLGRFIRGILISHSQNIPKIPVFSGRITACPISDLTHYYFTG
jgi:hypothetical protein